MLGGILKKKILVAILLFVIVNSSQLFAQKELNVAVSQRIILNFIDQVVYADVMANERKQEPDLDLYYYWYKANDIKKTKGGYEGKLLHGNYTEFYPNKDLKQQGKFKYGIKIGLWKTWHANGELASLVKWKKGKMQGDFKFFDEKGNMLKQGCYRDDVFHGKINTYLPDGNVESCTYKNGKIKADKSRKIGLKFWKKKNKASDKNALNPEKVKVKKTRKKSKTEKKEEMQFTPQTNEQEPSKEKVKQKKEKKSENSLLKESKRQSKKEIDRPAQDSTTPPVAN